MEFALFFIVVFLISFVYHWIFEHGKKPISDSKSDIELIENARLKALREFDAKFNGYEYKEPLTDEAIIELAHQDLKNNVYGQAFSYQEYQDYLNSEAWKTKRNSRLETDHFHCKYCGSKNNLQVHHYHYRTLKHENIYTDLVSLCKQCHNNLHDEFSLEDMEFIIKKRIAENK